MASDKKPAQNDHLVYLSTRIPRSLLRALKLHCVHHDVTMATVITQAIRTVVADEETRR